MKHRFKQAVHWLLGFHGSPRQVARGMGIGVFVAFLPPLGFQMLTAAVMATVVRGNRAAAIAGTWVTNPLTSLPLYLMAYRLGLVFTPDLRPVDVRSRLRAVVLDENDEWLDFIDQFHQLLSLGKEVLVPMTIGGVVIGIVSGLAAYLLTRAVIEYGPRFVHLPHAMKRRERKAT